MFGTGTKVNQIGEKLTELQIEFSGFLDEWRKFLDEQRQTVGQNVKPQEYDPGPFAADKHAGQISDMLLHSLDEEQILAYLRQAESLKTPKHFLDTCMTVCNFMPNHMLSAIVNGLDDVRDDLLAHIAGRETLSTDVLSEVSSELKLMLDSGYHMSRGLPLISRILSVIEPGEIDDTVNALKLAMSHDEVFVEAFDRHVFLFDDIARLDDYEIQHLLRETDTQTLVMALKLAPDDVKEKVFLNMGNRLEKRIKEDFEALGPVRLTEAYAAQALMIACVHRMIEEENIVWSAARPVDRPILEQEGIDALLRNADEASAEVFSQDEVDALLGASDEDEIDDSEKVLSEEEVDALLKAAQTED